MHLVGVSSTEFIKRSYTPTYDCPKASLLLDIEKVQLREDLSPEQVLQLNSMRTHSLICAGKITEAQQILQELLASPIADRSAQYYVSAVYQYGFAYDMQENPERCNYYMLARDASKGKYGDIHASASLGYVTECIKGQVQEQLGQLYTVLENITRMDDKAALAHAYNRVGLFYAGLSQNSLAASQYLKAIEVAEGIYTDSNMLTLVLSAFTASMASNNLEQAGNVLEKFELINKNVNTPTTNVMQSFMQAGYQIRTQDFESLKGTLNTWNAMRNKNENPVYGAMFSWYSTELCLHEGDLACLQAFFEQQKNISESLKRFSNRSRGYLSLVARAQIALGNKDEALVAFDKFNESIIRRSSNIESSTNSLGVANLHQQITELEGLVAQQKERRSLIIKVSIALLVVIAVLTLWFFRRKTLQNRAYDSVTGLLNNTAVLHKIASVSSPGEKRTNALAIFDIANFTEVNLRLGSTKGDFVLTQIANTFKNITRTSDVIGHLGPGQFILCIADIEEDAAQAFFERTKEALTNTFADQHHHQPISVDSSMSIYYSTEAFNDLNDILNNMMLSLSMKAGTNKDA